jgi:hypothetical protein
VAYMAWRWSVHQARPQWRQERDLDLDSRSTLNVKLHHLAVALQDVRGKPLDISKRGPRGLRASWLYSDTAPASPCVTGGRIPRR